MKRGSGWFRVLVGACVIGAVCVARAEKAVEPAKPAEDKTVKAEAQKKQLAETQLNQVKKQIADRQKALQEATAKLAAGGKSEAMRPYFEKQIEFFKKSLDLLQQLQTALEAQNADQAAALRTQIQALATEWEIGEPTARMDAERAHFKTLLGDNPGVELKAAWDSYNAACDEILKKLAQKQALEKDLKDLRAKQGEAVQQFQKAAQLAKQKEKQQAKAAAPNPAPAKKK